MVLTLIPLLNNGIEHLIGLLGHLDILFCQVPAQISRLFFYELMVFFCFDLEVF